MAGVSRNVEDSGRKTPRPLPDRPFRRRQLAVQEIHELGGELLRGPAVRQSRQADRRRSRYSTSVIGPVVTVSSVAGMAHPEGPPEGAVTRRAGRPPRTVRVASPMVMRSPMAIGPPVNSRPLRLTASTPL
jgi:hypothetical protein